MQHRSVTETGISQPRLREQPVFTPAPRHTNPPPPPTNDHPLTNSACTLINQETRWLGITRCPRLLLRVGGQKDSPQFPARARSARDATAPIRRHHQREWIPGMGRLPFRHLLLLFAALPLLGVALGQQLTAPGSAIASSRRCKTPNVCAVCDGRPSSSSNGAV